jgi:hypothetical protein
LLARGFLDFFLNPDFSISVSASAFGTDMIIRTNFSNRSNALAFGSRPGTPEIARGRISAAPLRCSKLSLRERLFGCASALMMDTIK